MDLSTTTPHSPIIKLQYQFTNLLIRHHTFSIFPPSIRFEWYLSTMKPWNPQSLHPLGLDLLLFRGLWHWSAHVVAGRDGGTWIVTKRGWFRLGRPSCGYCMNYWERLTSLGIKNLHPSFLSNKRALEPSHIKLSFWGEGCETLL